MNRRTVNTVTLMIAAVIIVGVLSAIFFIQRSGGEDSSLHSPEEALIEQMHRMVQGQWGPAYEALHPAQQALISRDQFMSCQAERVRENPPPSDLEMRVVDSYEEPVAIPLTNVTADSTAVTIEFSAQGETYSATQHVILHQGSSWRVIMTEEDLTTCLN